MNKESVELKDLLEKVNKNYLSDELELIKKAYQYALKQHLNKKRLNGEDYITHPLEVAMILADLNVDHETIIAALIHETMNHASATKEEIETLFGAGVAGIVSSISKINRLELSDNTEAAATHLRKVLIGLSEDVRVLFVKLADRLHNLRTAYALPKTEIIRKANETIQVLIPIAHRLGIYSIKTEMEDLCLRYIKPDVYNDILKRLDASRNELKDLLEEMQDAISEVLIDNNIKFVIKSRVKSVHSIYKKLDNGKNWNKIYDILAMRVILDNVSDCYLTVGLIHSKYRPIPGRFKDYIAMPKQNMYQSLHTGVFGANGHIFEIQIRTQEMDELSEKGMASHWSYKEKGSKKIHSNMEQKLEIFRSIIENNGEYQEAEIENRMNTEIFNDFIYVFTPKGDVIELPKASTPIDFAYRIHSAVGDKTTGALVNDVIVPLDHELQDNDIVKMMTTNGSVPKKEWLQFVKTTQARNKIKSFFSKQDRENYIEKGKTLIERELRKQKLSFDTVFSNENIKKVLADLKVTDIMEVYFLVGSLRYTSHYIVDLTRDEKKNVTDVLIERIMNQEIKKVSYKNDVIVQGIGDIRVNLAKCCQPVKGDPIIGYITKGEGVSVHRSDCINVTNKKERLIEVAWNETLDNYYFANISVSTLNDKNYLLDIITKATSKNVYVESVKTISDDKINRYDLTVKMKNVEELDLFLQSLYSLAFVLEARRN